LRLVNYIPFPIRQIMSDMAAGTESTARTNPMLEFSAGSMPMIRKIVEAFGWLMMAVLIFTAVTSIFGRADFLNEMAATENPAEAANAFDIRYWEHSLATWTHLIGGMLIMVIGPLQFLRPIRKNYTNFHRWSGRVFLLCGSMAALSGVFIGVFYPFAGLEAEGFNESMATAYFGAYTLFCLIKAYTSVRARDFGAHREWMIRSWALMLAIATERVMLGILMSNTNVGIEVLFGTTFWMAGVTNIAASEIWINLTRTPGNGARHWKDVDAKAAA
jgi:uncharacterized membrane protein